MALADKLIRTANKLLNKFQVVKNPAYIRQIDRVGGDALTGRGAQVNLIDTPIIPYPLIEEVTLSLKISNKNPSLVAQDQVVQVGDYIMYISVDAVTEQELKSPDTLIVFKDEANNLDNIRWIVSVTNIVVNGQVVLYQTLLREKATRINQ